MLPPGMAPPGELEDGLDGVLLPGDPGGAPEGELCGEPGIPPLGVLGMPEGLGRLGLGMFGVGNGVTGAQAKRPVAAAARKPILMMFIDAPPPLQRTLASCN